MGGRGGVAVGWTDGSDLGMVRRMGPVLGKQLMIVGAMLIVLGALLRWWQPSRGGLPGDLVIERPGFSVHVPIVTCLVLSLVLSLILRWLNR